MAEEDEDSADCRLVARLCGVLEAVADGAPLAETSAACRAAIADHVVELERAEAAGEAAAAAAADALDGVLAVWHLCEACCLDAPPVRACRLAAWLRAHAFDGGAERDEFDALAPLLARLDAPAEAWAPDDNSDDDEAPGGSPVTGCLARRPRQRQRRLSSTDCNPTLRFCPSAEPAL